MSGRLRSLTDPAPPDIPIEIYVPGRDSPCGCPCDKTWDVVAREWVHLPDFERCPNRQDGDPAG
jgi:hypothetical protein